MADTSTLLNHPPSAETLTKAVRAEGTEPSNFSAFTFKRIGQPPTLLNRFTAPEPGYRYHRSPSPEASSDMDLETPAKTTIAQGSRKSLLEALTGDGQAKVATPSSPLTTTAQVADKGDPRQVAAPNMSHPSPPFTPRGATPKSSHTGTTSIQLPLPSNSSQRGSPPLSTQPSTPAITAAVINDQDSQQDQDDNQAFPPSSPSPFAIIDHLEDIARERAEMDKIRDLRKQFKEEREELSRRDQETVRAVQRSTEQSERVMFIVEEAFSKMETLILKHEKRLNDEKKKAHADIVAKRVAEKDYLRRQAQEREKRRKEEENRKALEEAESRRKEAEVRLIKEQEEARKLEEQRKLQEIEERRKEEEERIKAEEDAKRKQHEQEELIRKQEEMRKQLERRKKSEEEKQQKETEAKEAEARRQAEYEMRKAAFLKTKWAINDNNGLPLQTSEPSPNHHFGITSPRASPTSLLPSPAASSTSSQQTSPDDINERSQRVPPPMAKRDSRSSSATAKKQLQASFVPATTEAGKLVSTDMPLTSVKSEDGTTKPQELKRSTATRTSQAKTRKGKLKEPVEAKKEPLSPCLPAPSELGRDLPPVNSTDKPLPPVVLPPSENPLARVPPPGPARNATTMVRAVAPPGRPLPELPPRPSSATAHDARYAPFQRQKPTHPDRPRSPAPSRITPPYPYARGRSPTPSISPPPSPGRGRSPGRRGTFGNYDHYDHYSPPSAREHWSPAYYRPTDSTHRDLSPALYVPRKRARDSAYWVPSDDPRTGIASKRRAVRDPSPKDRVPSRSPPSPRTRRVSAQDRGVTLPTLPHNQAGTEAYDTRRRPVPPPKHPSKWSEGREAPQRPLAPNLPPRPKNVVPTAAPDALLKRITDVRSPTRSNAAPTRKAFISLEQRLTSVPNSGMPLGERLS